MVVPKQTNLDLFLRRRSTHIYQSIIVETNEIGCSHSGNCPELTISEEHNSDVSFPRTNDPWKIFVLTTSVTNYFCCGCNVSRAISRLKKCSIGSPINWAVEKLGGEEIAGIKKKLASSLTDWVLDLSTTVSHLLNSSWVDGGLTYLIVLLCGIISTVAFLRYPDIRSTMKIKAKEVGVLWSVLLFIPTFFSVTACRLWLYVASRHQALEETSEDLGELSNRFKDWTLKALWLETVLEAKPQAVLQSMFLIERTLAEDTSTTLDFLPVLLSLWSMYTVTNSIYELVVLNFVDRTGIFAKLYGNTYTAMSTLAPAMIISVIRKLVRSNKLEELFLTLSSMGLYYIIFEVIYQLTYIFCKLFSSETKRHAIFVKVYTTILVLVFLSCMIIWGYYNQAVTLKIQISMGIFVVILALNSLSCFKASDFVEECFRLKNVKIDEAWSKYKFKPRLQDQLS